MPQERPTFHAEIGKFLVHLRRMKGWSQRKTIAMARQHGIARSTPAYSTGRPRRATK